MSERTNEVRAIGGIRLARHTAVGADASTSDVWWSDEQALPSGFAILDGATVTRFSIASAKAGVHETLLRPTRMRFPRYRVFDLADWLERH